MAKRKKYSAEFKAKVALEALQGELTMAQLSAKYGVHANLITKWKATAREGMVGLFSGKQKQQVTDNEVMIKELHAKIGELTVERDFFVKSLRALSHARRKDMIDSTLEKPSIARQCTLLSFSRSTFYYVPKGESELNLKLMRLIDERFLKRPSSGSRQMSRWLRRQGYCVNRKRIRRLMRLMGIEAVHPKPKTSIKNHEHRIYPYLLRGVTVDRPNQVWCTDITYIPMRHGFMYLMAIMDWYSRRILSWRLSNTLDTEFCVAALEDALTEFGPPQIFNSDQGCQFTSLDFTGTLKAAGVRISMDGKGRWMDNVFIERLWRTLKYECVYLNEFESGSQARQVLGEWFEDYNQDRSHSSLDDWTPNEAYRGERDSIPEAA